MKSSSVLDHVVIGYSPVYDHARKLTGLRLSVFPVDPALTAADGESLWEILGEALAQAPARPDGLPALWVSIASEVLLDGLLNAAQRTPHRLLIEVPAFLAEARSPLLQSLANRAQPLALSGAPSTSLATLEQTGFVWWCRSAQVVQDPAQTWSPRGLPVLLEGARSEHDFESALRHGAAAVAGWPMDDDLHVATPASVPPELRGVLDLLNRVEREEPVERLEAVLTADPSLAYRLLRYLNASALGLRAEISSFRHGLLMLGHRRLKRWLSLLLVTGSQDPQSRMLMAVAARRGLILDELASGLGDEAMRGEMFICGVFSLLDRMLRVPMGELIRSVPMSQRVQDSLLGNGPYRPYLDLLRAVEGGSAVDIRECAEAALVGCGEVNRAVLKGLALAWELD